MPNFGALPRAVRPVSAKNLRGRLKTPPRGLMDQTWSEFVLSSALLAVIFSYIHVMSARETLFKSVDVTELLDTYCFNHIIFNCGCCDPVNQSTYHARLMSRPYMSVRRRLRGHRPSSEPSQHFRADARLQRPVPAFRPCLSQGCGQTPAVRRVWTVEPRGPVAVGRVRKLTTVFRPPN